MEYPTGNEYHTMPLHDELAIPQGEVLAYAISAQVNAPQNPLIAFYIHCYMAGICVAYGWQTEEG